jgi:hypothetical protein
VCVCVDMGGKEKENHLQPPDFLHWLLMQMAERGLLRLRSIGPGNDNVIDGECVTIYLCVCVCV